MVVCVWLCAQHSRLTLPSVSFRVRLGPLTLSACTGCKLKLLSPLRYIQMSKRPSGANDSSPSCESFQHILILFCNDKIISASAPQVESPKDGEISESDMEPPCKTARRGSGGKTATDWKLHLTFQSTNHSNVISCVQKELEDLIPSDLALEAHPYQKKKATSPRKPEHGSFWHVKHPRKNGATLSCPFAATMCCPFQIKYKIKGDRLTMFTRAQHDHVTEIRKRGLRDDSLWITGRLQ